MTITAHLLALLRATLLDRQRLALENLALRQQLVVLHRGVTRPKLEDRDRIFWIGLMRLLGTWRDTLHIVKPDTIVSWHRRGWNYNWRRKSRPHTVGRPAIGWELVTLIKRMSRENPLWDAPRIKAELALLEHNVAKETVSKYMVRHRPPDRGQSWSTFLQNHMAETIACDFFTVPTLTFRSLFVFVVLHHETRRIVHVNVTANPTAEWTAQQLVEALGSESAPEPKHLLRDRDGIFGHVFQRKVKALALTDLVTPKASPWCNGFAERVIGTLRRECTDHVIALNEHHLNRMLQEFVEYYNTGRCHQSLDGNAPEPRQRWSLDDGHVQSRPVLGGLHHVYSRAA